MRHEGMKEKREPKVVIFQFKFMNQQVFHVLDRWQGNIAFSPFFCLNHKT
jgi:hypothetical protein